MSEFEYFLAFFGLLLGLTVAEVAIKSADALDAHPARPLGLLTPMLAGFVLLDIASFWLWTWSMRDLITVSWRTIIGTLVVALCYFLSASLIFPRTTDWPSLNEHYWARKRYVLAGIIFANAIFTGVQLARLLPQSSDSWFFIWQSIYWLPLIGLWFSRSRRVDLALLVTLILQFTLDATNIIPDSQWAGSLASTTSVTDTK